MQRGSVEGPKDQVLQQAELQFAAGHYARAAELLLPLLRTLPTDAAVRVNLGLCRQRMGDLPAAEMLYREAIGMDAGFAQAWTSLGDLLRESGQPETAFEALQRAVVLAPGHASAHLGLGLLLQQYGRVGEAVAALRRALACDPGAADTWCNLGTALQDAGAIAEALAAYRKALALAPGHRAAASNLLMGMQYDGAKSARELRQAAADWGHRMAVEAPLCARVLRKPGRLRIGYVSGDFAMHPVGWFFLPVAQAHDRTVIETFCYANQARRDAMTGRIEAAVDHWRDIRALDDAATCRLVERDGIDVLVDLSGHTAGGRLGVFARKPAPLQFSWLGYFASTGLASIDAVILGSEQAGPGGQAFFVEPIELLARSHFCYAPPAYAPPVRDRAADHDHPLVFGSFGNTAKLNDDVIRTWSRVLAAVPGSRLLLKWKTLADASCLAELVARFAQAGCSIDRIELRGPSEHAAMLAEYGEIDIALDPYPFSGALTSYEALWMGVPVVTLGSMRPVGRQTLALLRCVGLDELVAQTPDEYVAIARRLAADRQRLCRLRSGLRAQVVASPLLDGAGLARALEGVYQRYAAKVGLVAAVPGKA